MLKTFSPQNFPFLYYERKSSTVEYSSQPYGNPDVIRLAEGNPNFWQKPTSKIYFKKKNLIVADWWISMWQRGSPARHVLNLLIQDGFLLYVLNKNHLTPIYHSNMLSYYSIEPMQDKVLYDIAYEQLKLAKDDVGLLYHVQLKMLLGYSKEQCYTISIKYLNKDYDTQYIKALNKHNQCIHFNTVLLEEKEIDNQSQILARWPELRIQYKPADPSESAIHEELFSKAYHQVPKSLVMDAILSDEQMAEYSFSDLRFLALGRSDELQQFKSLIQINPNLRSLVIRNSMSHSFSELMPTTIAGEIEYLYVTVIKDDELSAFRHLPLKLLHVNYFESLLCNETLAEFLNGIDDVHIEIHDLQLLKLNLSSAIQLDTVKTLCVDIDCENQNINQLNAFLNSTTHLLSMEIDLNSENALEQIDFPASLESLSINTAEIDLTDLENILRSLPNLKKLKLEIGYEKEKYIVLELESDEDWVSLRELAPNSHLYQLLNQLEYLYIHPAYDFRLAPNTRNIPFNVTSTNDSVEENGEFVNEDPEFLGEDPEFLGEDTEPRGLSSAKQRIINTCSNYAHFGHSPVSNPTYHIPRIFYNVQDINSHPAPAHYRIGVYNQGPSIYPGGVSHLLEQVGDLNLDETKTPPLQQSIYLVACQDPLQRSYYGKQIFTLNDTWQPIASLTPRDVISAYHVTPALPVDIQYSHRDNLYYIRSQSAGSFHATLEFVLYEEESKLVSLPFIINLYIDLFRYEFGYGTLNLSQPDSLSHKDYLLSLIDQKIGSCEERAILFFHLMIGLGFPKVRIIKNVSHAFIELCIDDQWVTCDLGGYPATTHMEESIDNNLFYSAKQHLYERQLEELVEPNQSNSCDHSKSNIDFIPSLFHSSEPHLTQLITIPRQDLQALHQNLRQYAKENQIPFYDIHNPDDLICKSAFVTLNDSLGVINPGPGGTLHRFLTTKHAIAPTIFINYSTFKPDDFVRYNRVIEPDSRFIDGTSIPSEYNLIGLIDPETKDVYQENDFYSRFKRKVVCPISLPPLAPILPVFNEQHSDYRIINLCHSANWKNMLLGGFRLQQGRLVFKTGELQDALSTKNCKPIIIQNPPKDELFETFWRFSDMERVFKTKEIECSWPEGQIFYYQEGYNWSLAQRQIVRYDPNRLKHHKGSPRSASSCELRHDEKLLNPGLLARFFYQYKIDEDHQLTQTPGLIESHANAKQHLAIYLTRALQEDEWGLFFNYVQKYPTLRVSFIKAPEVHIPSFLENWVIDIHTVSPCSHTQYMYTMDRDFTTAKIAWNHQNTIVLDISECSAKDLLISLNTEIREEQRYFWEKEQCLIKLLSQNKTVILTGQFSDELWDELLVFVNVRTQDSEALGQLYIVTENNLPGFNMPPIHPSTEEKRELLLQKYSEIELQAVESLLKKESFVHLVAYLDEKKLFPAHACQHTFQGLMNSRRIEIESKPICFNIIKDDAQLFLDARLNAVISRFNSNQPYLFLMGPTGAGKSRFVLDELLPYADIFIGENNLNLVDWVNADTDKPYIVLFIDEANLSNRQWSEFEGLFQAKPGILIQGQYYALSTKHKVIFAGNPLHYGDRSIAPLFSRHGLCLSFHPMSCAVLYEKTIKPMVSSLLHESFTHCIAKPILTVYDYLLKHTKNEVLISPRQVQSMILQTCADFYRQPYQSIEMLTSLSWFYAISIAKEGIPLKSQGLKQSFEQAFCSFSIYPMPVQIPDFYSNYPSRQPLLVVLIQYLGLRDYQRSLPPSLSHDIRFGGLNRFVIVGESGVGKTKLLKNLFEYLNIQKATLTMPTPENGSFFYHMDASDSITQQRALLLRAFDEGAIIWIDEMNSMVSLEQDINSLLEGKHPDEKGRPPKQPGFRIIGTQNPATMAGRNIESPALKNRSITQYLPRFPKEEIEQTLYQKGFYNSQKRKNLVDAFFSVNKRHKATLRELSQLADAEILDESIDIFTQYA